MEFHISSTFSILFLETGSFILKPRVNFVSFLNNVGIPMAAMPREPAARPPLPPPPPLAPPVPPEPPQALPELPTIPAMTPEETLPKLEVLWVWVKIRYPNNWMVNTKLD